MNKGVADFDPDTSWRTDGSARASAETEGCGGGCGCGGCGGCSCSCGCGSCGSCSCSCNCVANDADYVTDLSPITSVPAENFALGFPNADAHVGTTAFGAYSDTAGAQLVGNTVIGNTVVTYDGHGDAHVFSAATGDTLNVTVNPNTQTITVTQVPVGGG